MKASWFVGFVIVFFTALFALTVIVGHTVPDSQQTHSDSPADISTHVTVNAKAQLDSGFIDKELDTIESSVRHTISRDENAARHAAHTAPSSSLPSTAVHPASKKKNKAALDTAAIDKELEVISHSVKSMISRDAPARNKARMDELSEPAKSAPHPILIPSHKNDWPEQTSIVRLADYTWVINLIMPGIKGHITAGTRLHIARQLPQATTFYVLDLRHVHAQGEYDPVHHIVLFHCPGVAPASKWHSSITLLLMLTCCVVVCNRTNSWLVQGTELIHMMAY